MPRATASSLRRSPGGCPRAISPGTLDSVDPTGKGLLVKVAVGFALIDQTGSEIVKLPDRHYIWSHSGKLIGGDGLGTVVIYDRQGREIFKVRARASYPIASSGASDVLKR